MIIPRLDHWFARSLAIMSSHSTLSPPQATAEYTYEVVDYPIPGNNRGHLHLFVGKSGNPSAIIPSRTARVVPRQLVLTMGGFPDDQSVFHPLARRLADLPEICAVGVICMPGFDVSGRPSSDSSSREHPRGYSFDECATTVQNAAAALRSRYEDEHEDAPTTLTGVFHDWGVVAGLVWANRALEVEPEPSSPHRPPDRLVLLDVCAGLHPSTRTINDRSPSSTKKGGGPIRFAANWLYQIQLAMAFVLQRWGLRRISDSVGLGLNTGSRLAPLRDVDQPYIEKLRIPEWKAGRIGCLCYPYWNIIVDGLSGKFGETWGKHWHLPMDLHRTTNPCCY